MPSADACLFIILGFIFLLIVQQLLYQNLLIYPLLDITFDFIMCVSQVAPVIKNLPANAGDTRDANLTPELGRTSGKGNGNPLQYSYLENFMDRGAWQATVHTVAKS